MSKITPTPWVIGYGDGISGDVASWGCFLDEQECHEVVIRHDQEAVAMIFYGDPDGPSEANARHIVHCVNNYDRLVEALREVLDCWEDDSDVPEGNPIATNARALLAQLDTKGEK